MSWTCDSWCGVVFLKMIFFTWITSLSPTAGCKICKVTYLAYHITPRLVVVVHYTCQIQTGSVIKSKLDCMCFSKYEFCEPAWQRKRDPTWEKRWPDKVTVPAKSNSSLPRIKERKYIGVFTLVQIRSRERPPD